MIDYKKRFVEVDEILKYLTKKDFDKIPVDVINLIRKYKDNRYIWRYDTSKRLEEQNVHKDSVTILSYINAKFILEGKQKKLMEFIHYYNEIKKEELKRKEFTNKKIFK